MSSCGLSAAIITLNEDTKIKRCLDSLKFVDDIVVLDCGSSDHTVDIAVAAGCRVFVEEWKGYGAQKQSAIDKCFNDWVLSIDADEVIPPETASIIKDTLESSVSPVHAYTLSRKNFIGDRWIRYCGWWPDRVVRLFDRRFGRMVSPVHERWVTEGKVCHIDAWIEHYSFTNYSDMMRKFDLYSTLSANRLFDDKKKVNLLTPVLHGAFAFFKTFILKLGFLGGIDGLVISTITALGSFMKYAKLLDMYATREKT